MLLIIEDLQAQILDKCENKSEPFYLSNGASILCDDAIFNPNYCDKEVFKKHCPKACNTCCRDQPNKFTIEGDRNRRCSVLELKPHLCNKDHFRNNCPVSCGICPCRDHTGKFVNKVNKPISCNLVDKYEIKCRSNLFKTNCPGEIIVFECRSHPICHPRLIFSHSYPCFLLLQKNAALVQFVIVVTCAKLMQKSHFLQSTKLRISK